MLLVLAAVGLTADSAAALQPQEVGIIAMGESQDSRHVAEYYAKARGIPAENILLLEGKPSISITRDRWDKKVRPEIIALLEKNNLGDKIRCLVTCWDVPLWIDRLPTSATQYQSRKNGLVKQRAALIEEFERLLTAMEAFGRKEPPREKPDLLESTTEEQLKNAFSTSMKGIQERSAALTSDAEKAKVQGVLQQCFFMANGSDGMLQIMAAHTDSKKLTPEQKMQQALMVLRTQTMQQVVAEMETLPGSESVDQLMLDFVQGQSGLMGAVRWIDGQMSLLQKNESYSSFDSELSLIFYPDYAPLSWIPNPLHYSRDGRRKRRVMMVSRLEAPTVQIVERMIDDAVAVEKEGLKGNVYIDARGIKPDSGKGGPNTFYQYDQSLNDLAERLRKHTSLTVVSNNWAELFKPGDCPDAALYCGWYSLRKYIDAFEWKRGAVGYHLASYEAKWLRKPEPNKKPEENPWCPAMLQDGVCATLGPVLEPYLSAFPLPDDFFPLLLTGKLTLAEVYYRTLPFNSWTLVLIGDPLYTPYKTNPMLDVKDLPERLGGQAEKKE